MALREIGEDGSTHDVLHLPHRREFDATWLLIPAAQRAAIEAEINRRLDDLISSPDPNTTPSGVGRMAFLSVS
jgi:hypothetical protein